MIRTNEAKAYWLVPVNSSGIPGTKSTARPISSLGPDGTNDDGVPGVVEYETFREKYGIFSVRNLTVQYTRNVEGVLEIHIVLLVIPEDAPGNGVTMGAVNATDDNIPFTTGDGIVEGDFVVWNDVEDSGETAANQPPPSTTPLSSAMSDTDTVMYVQDSSSFPASGNYDVYFDDGIVGLWEGVTVTDGWGTNALTVTRAIQGTAAYHAAGTVAEWYPNTIAGTPKRKYECNQVIANPAGSTNLYLLRHYPPDPRPGTAYFESFKVAHVANKKVYKLTVRHFTFKVQKDAIYTGASSSGLPERLDMVIPSSCVVASLMSLQNYYGYGPWTTVNCSSTFSSVPSENPPAPGLRTLAGQSYLIPLSGTLTVGTTSVTPIRIQDSASIRCIYAEVESAPVGSSILIQVKYSLTGTASPVWTNLEVLTIVSGAKQSFSPTGTNTPSDRSMPYAIEWPTPPMLEDYWISFDITQVGSSTAGSDLIVYLQT